MINRQNQLPPPPRAPKVSAQQNFSKRAPESLRASLDELLEVEVQRLLDEESSRHAELRRLEQDALEEQRLHELEAKRKTRELIAAHEARLAREAEAKQRVHAAKTEVLDGARQSMARRAADSVRRRLARHESSLGKVQGDPDKRKLRAVLSSTLLCLGLVAVGGGLRFGELERSVAAETTALTQRTHETQDEAAREVARLRRLLADIESTASLTRSTLEAELARAEATLAELGERTEPKAGPTPQPRPAPRRLATQTNKSSGTSAAKTDQTVATAEPIQEVCLPYDPMCFSL